MASWPKVVPIEETTAIIEAGDRRIAMPTNQPLHLDYAYTTTAQDTYYVSISRERHEVIVFTDDAQK